MPISIIVLTVVLLGAAAALSFAVRDSQGAIGRWGRALAVVAFLAGAFALTGALTAEYYGGRPFGLNLLKPPYDIWLERFENPTRPLV